MSFTTLETTNFPLYAVNVLDKDHFLIAGGGGAAKTGVPNALVCANCFHLFSQIFYSSWRTVLFCLVLSLRDFILDVSFGDKFLLLFVFFQ